MTMIMGFGDLNFSLFGRYITFLALWLKSSAIWIHFLSFFFFFNEFTRNSWHNSYWIRPYDLWLMTYDKLDHIGLDFKILWVSV